MITLAEYVNGHMTEHEEEWTPSVEVSAKVLIERVNTLLVSIQWEHPVVLTSGWRPRAHNAKIGGSSHSYHIFGKALDIADPEQILASRIMLHHPLLHTLQLWMESPAAARTWVHLDTGDRQERAIRIFNP